MSAPRDAGDHDAWPEGVLAARAGPGGNCSSSGSAIDLLFWASLGASSLLVALAAAFPPSDADPDADAGVDAGPSREPGSTEPRAQGDASGAPPPSAQG